MPPGSPSINNSNVTGNAINPVTYQGIRVEALYKFNDDWDLLITQSYQDMNSQGVFYQQPNASDGAPLAPLEVTLFNPSFDKDKFESTAWTLNGKLSVLKAVYTGGYLVRNVEQVGDYTNYARGVYADYYQCYGPGRGPVAPGDLTLTPTCFSPSATWRSNERNTHQQHEFRLSTPDEWRIRAIAGAFWEKNTLYDQSGWGYKTVPSCTPTNSVGCFADIGTAAGASVVNPGVQPAPTSFYQDTVRSTKQTAFFASIDFDLIPKVLTLTAGTRHFRFDNYSAGSVTGSFGCFEQGVPAGGCLADNFNLNGQNLRNTETGFKSRGNLTWHVTPDLMVYYTYSQGFRPGGFNRSTDATTAAYTCATGSRDAGNCKKSSENQYYKPNGFDSDDLVNNEIGVKSEFLDHRVQINASAYRMKWSNVQLPLFDPTGLGNTTFVVNGPTYVVKGLEVQLVARVTEGLTIQGSSSYNNSKQTNSPCLVSDVPTTAKNTNPTPLGDCITQIKNSPYVSPFGITGTTPAFSPLEQFNIRARYDWTFGDYKPFAMVGANHVGSMRNEPASFPSGSSSFCSPQPTTTLCLYTMPGYTTYDAAIGVAKDNWTAQLSGANLSNSDASQNTSSGGFIESQVPLRPRVLTATIGYKF